MIPADLHPPRPLNLRPIVIAASVALLPIYALLCGLLAITP